MIDAMGSATRDLPAATHAEHLLIGLALHSAHAHELACAVAAAAWTDERAIDCAAVLRAHAARGERATEVSLLESLKSIGVDEADAQELVSQYAYVIGGDAEADQAAKLVRGRHAARVSITQCEQVAAMIRRDPDNAAAIMQRLAEAATDLGTLHAAGGFVHAVTAVDEALDEAQRRAKGDTSGLIVTGVDALDGAPVNGLEAGDLVTWVMVSGHGKTAAMVLLSLRAAYKGTGVAFCSCEMAKRKIGRRWLAADSGTTFQKLKALDFSTYEMKNVVESRQRIAKLPLYIDDTSTPALAHLLAQVRRLKRKHPNIGIVVIDYMTLVGGVGNTFVEQYNSVVRALKKLAKELGVAIIGLVQPDAKTIEKRADAEQMPRLDDIAWCQEFRNQSDKIVCGYRPGRSEVRNLPPGAFSKSDTRGLFVVAKDRDNAGGEFEWAWWGGAMAFDGGCWSLHA